MKYFFIVASLILFVGCSNDTEPEVEKEVANEPVENLQPIRFGEIEVMTKNKIVYVTGVAETDADIFYFTLEQDGKVLIKETEAVLTNTEIEWKGFELELELEEEQFTNEETPLLTFYGKSNGEIVNPHYIPVDLMTY